MTEILFCARTDWNNVGWQYAKALRTVGVDAEALTCSPHPFECNNTARVVTLSEMRNEAEKARVIVNMYGELVQPLEHKHLVISHGHTPYGMNSLENNERFNSVVDFTIIQSGDLLDFGAKNEEWLLPPIDVAAIQPVFSDIDRPIRISHFPRETGDNGTPEVRKTLDGLTEHPPPFTRSFDFEIDEKTASYAENLKRLSRCDIYIDTLKSIRKGKKYGIWGVTALEAAALGKIVVTNCLHVNRYKMDYGPCALQVANTPDGLARRITWLLKQKTRTLTQMQHASREWVETQHSYQAIGRRLKEGLFRYCQDGKQKGKMERSEGECACSRN